MITGMFRPATCIVMTTALLAAVTGCGNSDNGANALAIPGVVTGPIEPITESVGIFVWGDSFNQLCHQWSIARQDASGWFYGTSVPWSSADVFVLEAPGDPLAVVTAESFEYTAGSVNADIGDTVFFRGRNGFFGAWTITGITGGSDAVLTGQWYFKVGGGGDFTGEILDGGESLYDANVGVCDGY